MGAGAQRSSSRRSARRPLVGAAPKAAGDGTRFDLHVAVTEANLEPVEEEVAEQRAEVEEACEMALETLAER